MRGSLQCALIMSLQSVNVSCDLINAAENQGHQNNLVTPHECV